MIEAPPFVDQASAFAASKRACSVNPGKATITGIWGNTNPFQVQGDEREEKEKRVERGEGRRSSKITPIRIPHLFPPPSSLFPLFEKESSSFTTTAPPPSWLISTRLLHVQLQIAWLMRPVL